MEPRYDPELILQSTGSLRRPPDEPRALGSWLSRVMRNLAASALRPGTYRLSLRSRAYRRGKFEETGPGWGNSRLEPAGPERKASIGEVQVVAGQTAVFQGAAK